MSQYTLEPHHVHLLTLAGENIELPIATDHNVHIDRQFDFLRAWF